jgi:LacI family transcriptional regulator
VYTSAPADETRAVQLAPHRAPTLHDVAAAAGVSTATVSRALNGGPVSERRRRLVLDAVQTLGYRPNTLARGLVTGRSGAVGVLIPDVAGPLYATLTSGIEDVLRSAGVDFMMMTGNRDPGAEAASIEALLERRVDALVLIGSWHAPEALRPVLAAGRPVVLVEPEGVDHDETGAELADVTIISLADQDAAVRAAEYLIERGHTRIAHLRGVRRAGARRLAGYRAAMAAAGLDAGPVVAGDFSEPAGAEALPALLEAGVSAVFCANDRMALGVYHALASRGLRVPDALSVVGFDDLPWAAYLDPPLTTVRHAAFDLGRLAARAALSGLRDGGSGTRLLVATEFFEHASFSDRRAAASVHHERR